MTMIPGKTPSAGWQRLNALLHQEPYSSIFYAIYWTVFLTLASPVGTIVLWIQAVGQVLAWIVDRIITGGRGYFNPRRPPSSQQRETAWEMAVVITGCDSGFGRDIALRAADAGFQVFAGCLSEASFEQYRLSTAIPLKMDVTLPEEINQAVQAVTRWLQHEEPIVDSSHQMVSPPPPPQQQQQQQGPHKKKRVLHALVNNAGIAVAGECDWLEIASYQKLIDVNYIGMVRTTLSFLPLLKNQSIQREHLHARIINLISFAGMVGGGTGVASYHASKFAAQAFSIGLRSEMAGFRIAVTTVNPSFHATPLIQSSMDDIQRRWDLLPAEKRAEYGEEYLATFKKLAVDVPLSVLWEAHVVTDQVMHCLTVKRAPIEVVVGSDARFLLVWYRMLPAWAVNLLIRAAGRPTPAAMLRK